MAVLGALKHCSAVTTSAPKLLANMSKKFEKLRENEKKKKKGVFLHKNVARKNANPRICSIYKNIML